MRLLPRVWHPYPLLRKSIPQHSPKLPRPSRTCSGSSCGNEPAPPGEVHYATLPPPVAGVHDRPHADTSCRCIAQMHRERTYWGDRSPERWVPLSERRCICAMHLHGASHTAQPATLHSQPHCTASHTASSQSGQFVTAAEIDAIAQVCQSSDERIPTTCFTASARWLIAFFSSACSSAKVWCIPVGMKIGS